MAMDRLDVLLSKLRHIDLSGEIFDVKQVLKGFGATCDVFVGFCQPIQKKVAVKRLRVFMSREEEFAKRFAKELYIWSKLDHPNVLPLLGYFIENNELPNLVSEWMERGTLHDNMKNVVSSADKLSMVIGIASGLNHLHLHDVIHADLKSQNVLISGTGEPLLTDFGVSRILACSLSTAGGTTSNLSSPKGTVRWMARELFQSDDLTDPQPHNKMSDVWAFGMVIYELLTHETPYHQLKTDMQVMWAIARGRLPLRPNKSNEDAVDDELWKLCHLCWNADPSARPTVENILIYLNQIRVQQSEAAEERVIKRNDSFPVFQPLPAFAAPRSWHPREIINHSNKASISEEISIHVRNATPRPLPQPPMTPKSQVEAQPPESGISSSEVTSQRNTNLSHRGRSSSQAERPPLAVDTNIALLPSTRNPARTTPTRTRKRLHVRNPTPTRLAAQSSSSNTGTLLMTVVTPDTPPLNIRKKQSGNFIAHPLQDPLQDTPSLPTPHTPRSKLQKEILDFRPSADGIYDALDDFFPDCDLDKPPVSASTPSTSPTVVEAPELPVPWYVSERTNKKARRSIRVVAAEQQRRLSDPSRYLQASVFERQSPRERPIDDGSGPSSSPRAQNAAQRQPFQWIRGQAIGRGTNSHIFLAMNGRTGELFAVKRAELPQRNLDDDRQAMIVNAMRRESGILKTVSHQNVVKYIGQEETSDYFHLFMEYVPGGNIAGCLKRHGKMQDQTIRSFTGQILAALEHLHDRGIIHCELKPDNILIDPSGVCKLCDFGLARRITGFAESSTNVPASSPRVSSPSWQMAIWVAPEIMRAAKNGEQYVYDVKVDIWALGCMVLEMVAGKPPWGDTTIFELINDKKMLPAVPADIELSPDADSFRRMCLSNFPAARLTASELLRHPFLELPRNWTFGGFH